MRTCASLWQGATTDEDGAIQVQCWPGPSERAYREKHEDGSILAALKRLTVHRESLGIGATR